MTTTLETDTPESLPATAVFVDQVHRDQLISERLRKRAESLSERAAACLEWSEGAPEPLRVAYRRRSAELNLHSIALKSAAEGLG